MELEAQRVWLRLLLNIQPDGRLVVGVTGDLGRTVRPLHTVGPAYGWSEVQLLPSEGVDIGPLKVRWPSALPEMLAHAIERLPGSRRGSNFPPAVPVFVTAPPVLALVSGDIVERLLRTIPMPAGAPAGSPSAGPLAIGEDRWVVLQDRVMPRPVLPFALPLDLVAVGARGAEALARVGPWVTPDQQLQPHLADVSWLEEPRDVLPRLAQRDVDILLIDASDARSLASMMRRGSRRPFTVRAVVVLGLGDGGPLDAVDVQVPVRNVLTVKGPPNDAQLAAVNSLLSALSHDLPLHDALVMARRENPAVLMDLAASPESLHDLRLTSAWAALERSLAELSGLVGPGTPEELRQQVSDRLGATGQDAGSDLITGVTEARTMQVDFARESRGLYPLARARLSLGLAAAASAALSLRTLRRAAPKPEAEQPPRVVNIGLRRGGDILAAPDAGSTYLDAIRSLVAGGRYELDVQIGAPWLHSLVMDDLDKTRLHLPDDRRGNELQVTIFSDDVVVLGEHTQPLHVPPAGPSDVLTFELALPKVVGPTWLRLSVFHRDNLLQTFRLAMLVTTTEAVHPEPVLTARLEHSATRDWTNVPELGDRVLSLTLNADPLGGHRIFLEARKGHGDAAGRSGP